MNDNISQSWNKAILVYVYTLTLSYPALIQLKAQWNSLSDVFSVPPSSPASYIALVLVTAHSLVDCTSTREGRPQNTSAAESHPRKDQSSGPKGPNHLQLALIPWYAPIWDNVKWVQMLTEEKGPKRLADPHLSPMKLSGKCQTINFLRQRTAGMTFYGLNLT